MKRKGVLKLPAAPEIEFQCVDRLMADEFLLWKSLPHKESRMTAGQHKMWITLQQAAFHREWAEVYRARLLTMAERGR